MESISWWDKFPERFHQHRYKTKLDQKQRLKIKATASMDKICRTGLAIFFYAAIRNLLSDNELLAQEIKSLEFYKDIAKNNEKSQIFIDPPKDVNIEKMNLSQDSKQLKNVVQVESLSFQSPFQTLNPNLTAQYNQMSKNKRAEAQYWKHSGSPRPTLIFIHGVVLNSYQRNSRIFQLNKLYEQGYDILLYTLPFHGARKEDKDLMSGLGFFSNGFAHINEAMLQSVFDLRIWINYLEDIGVSKIGVMGFSLGGYVCALAAAVDKRLSFAIPFSPMVLPIDMLMGWPVLPAFFKKLKNEHQADIHFLRQATAIHHAIHWTPSTNPKKMMIIGGAGDRFTSPIFVNALHQHWNGSRMYWYTGNHLLFLNHGKVLQEIKTFMDQCCDQ